jgi:hypothetical protein
MSHMGWQVRCRAKLPSTTPSRAAKNFAAGATLQRICAALERRSDAATAHRAHQSQTAPPLAGQMQSHHLVALYVAVARHCRFCRTRRNKIALECFSSNAKPQHVYTAFHASRSHRTLHVLFYLHITRHEHQVDVLEGHGSCWTWTQEEVDATTMTCSPPPPLSTYTHQLAMGRVNNKTLH